MFNSCIRQKLLLVISLIFSIAESQQLITQDFENASLINWYQENNHWCITDQDPIHGGYSLKHCYDSEVSSSDRISFFHAPLDPSEEIKWTFKIRYGKPPSGNNHWQVHFSENKLPETGCILSDGIFAGVNLDNNTDNIMVWEVRQGTVNRILETAYNWEERVGIDSAVTVTVQKKGSIYNLIIENKAEIWSLGQFTTESEYNFNIFSLLYTYSSTYDQNFWFDDLLIEGHFMKDLTPPGIESYSFSDPYHIEIVFDEPVRTCEGITWCIDGLGCALVNSGIAVSHCIEFPHAMVPGQSYHLKISHIADIYGNTNAGCVMELYYPAKYDLVVSEIMSDPTPPVSLPEAEYLELVNITGYRVNLKGWQLTVNSKKVELPEIIIDPGSYMLLTDMEDAALFNIENKAGINGFPVLPNQGAQIILQDHSGKLIHALYYTDNMIGPSYKKEGGWSLEIIDMNEPCAGNENWKASADISGGSPGAVNSVNGMMPDARAPELWRAAVSNTGSLVLYFSEPMDSSTAGCRFYYVVDGQFPDSVHCAWPITSKVEIFFPFPFLSGTMYTIELTSDICDCSGNPILQPAAIDFFTAVEADHAGIIINEFMFDPDSGFNEYVELYNVSHKSFDLKGYKLLWEGEDEAFVITDEYWPLLPGTYCIVARDYKGIDNPGWFDKDKRIVYTPEMPALPNSGTLLYLLSPDSTLIDHASYSESWHHPLLAKTKGVSLERISLLDGGTEADNWQSASSDAGYKTPADQNSQQYSGAPAFEVFLEPEFITPNEDGHEDEMLICYKIEKDGSIGRVNIYDISGNLCRILANGSLLGTAGSFSFDGRSEAGNPLPTGYYILFFEAIDVEGRKRNFKKAFVIAQ